MWRLHAVHPSIRRSYGLNGLMKHPLHQTLETIGGVAPLLILGIPVHVARMGWGRRRGRTGTEHRVEHRIAERGPPDLRDFSAAVGSPRAITQPVTPSVS